MLRNFGVALAAIAVLCGCALSAEADPPSAPKVIETSPAQGAVAVAPGQTDLTVKFSTPMQDKAWSFVMESNATFPEILGPPRQIGPATFVLGVDLKPNRNYVIWFNSAQHQNFRSIDGVSAKPYRLEFFTR